jgi:hypothetical protein
VLIDLPAHPAPPASLAVLDLQAVSDFLKTTLQMDRRAACQEERRHYAQICRDCLERSFTARIRAAQDRVMSLRAREAGSPEVALARQRGKDVHRRSRERRETSVGRRNLRRGRNRSSILQQHLLCESLRVRIIGDLYPEHFTLPAPPKRPRR